MYICWIIAINEINGFWTYMLSKTQLYPQKRLQHEKHFLQARIPFTIKGWKVQHIHLTQTSNMKQKHVIPIVLDGWTPLDRFVKMKNGTFWGSLVRFTFEPNTSFPWVWRVLPCELDPAVDCPPPLATLGCFSLDPEEDTGRGWFFKGFPSKRLPAPVNGLNLGSGSAGTSPPAHREVV